MKKISDNPTPKELADQIRAMNGLKVVFNAIPFTSRLFPNIAAAFEKMPSKEEIEQVLHLPDRFNEVFAQHGWIAYESMSSKAMELALTTEKESGLATAERALADHYDEGTLKFGILRMTGHADFRKRMRLLDLAKEDYLAGRYHACVPLLLSLLDGLVNDVSKHVGFFAENADMTAWDSIAAHETGLKVLAEIMGRNRKKTNEDEITVPFRNGILHGRDLAFDNKIVAAKCWAALFAVRDWAEALAKSTTKAKPKEDPSWSELFKRLAENERDKKALDAWKPRSVEDLRHLPCDGPPSALPENTPERAVAEFLDNWSRCRYGPMADALLDFVNTPPGKKAGNAKRDFGRSTPASYRIVSVTDKAAAASEVEAEIAFQGPHSAVNFRLSLHVVYNDTENMPVIRGHGKGSWKLVQNGFSEIIYGR